MDHQAFGFKDVSPNGERTVSNNEMKKGYPPAIVTNGDNICFNILCGICCLVLRAPVQTTCGHHFCKSCLSSCIKQNDDSNSKFVFCQPCKQDNNETLINEEEVYEDRNIAKLLDFLSVRCIRNFCQWQGKLENYDDHLANCSEEAVGHMNQSDVKRKISKEHKEKTDNKSKEDFVTSPLSIPLNQITFEMTSLQNSICHLQKKMEVITGKTTIFEGISAVFQSTAEKVLTQCEETKTLFAQQVRCNHDLKAQVETLRNDLLLLRRNLEQRPEEIITNITGELLWKISEVREKLRLAMAETVTHWLSPIFQTSQYGYKMQLKIYLNGDGTGKNKFVSLFFIILKSEYDNILSWPFQQKVKFTALDQSGRGHHVMDAFRPDLSSSSFQKPVGSANIATGCPLFLPTQMLEGDESRDSGVYVKDDAMFIKASVDRSGLER